MVRYYTVYMFVIVYTRNVGTPLNLPNFYHKCKIVGSGKSSRKNCVGNPLYVSLRPSNIQLTALMPISNVAVAF